MLQSITVIKILATLPLPPPSPAPKRKVELKNTAQIRIQNTPEQPGCTKKKKNNNLPGPLFRAFRHHF